MTAVIAGLTALAAIQLCGGESPDAARSVHLFYDAPPAAIFYNELTVEKSTPGSYFMACGFSHGYFGIQELAPGRDKVVLFSVWDPGAQDDPNIVAAEKRVKVLYQADDVRVGRFGGEGTGGQSFFKYDWKVGETCRFFVSATTNHNRTAYAAYFYLPGKRVWKHLVTFQTVTKGEPLEGFYSFVEDFRRDGKSPRELRHARFGNGWVRTPGGTWIELTRAKFTADNTPLDNIDAGVIGGVFHLMTGGDTVRSRELKSSILRPATGTRPVELVEAEKLFPVAFPASREEPASGERKLSKPAK